MGAADKFRKPQSPTHPPSAVDLLIEKGGSVADTGVGSALQPPVSTALHDAQTDALIKSYVIAAMTVGLVPVPLLDLTALIALQLRLLRNLCDHYQVDYSANLGRRWVYTLVAGSAPVLTVASLGSSLKLLPGFGTVAGTASVSVLSGGCTYAVGKVFARHFQAGGNLQDFRPAAVKTAFHHEYRSGREVAKQLS